MKRLILILIWLVLCASACNTNYISKQTLTKSITLNEIYSNVMFDTCIDELKLIEGFKSEPYFDIVANTIGYGHQLTKKDTIKYITKINAEILLIKDFKKRVNYVHTTYGLTGNKLLAIARFTFNLGHVNTKRLLAKPNIEARWLLYCNVKYKGKYKRSNHLYNCRKRELELWLS